MIRSSFRTVGEKRPSQPSPEHSLIVTFDRLAKERNPKRIEQLSKHITKLAQQADLDLVLALWAFSLPLPKKKKK